MNAASVQTHVWFRTSPEAALEKLPDAPQTEHGYVYAFSLANGMTRVGFGSNPKSRLRAAIADGKRRPESAVTECLISVAHREYWKTEFALHNRLKSQRQFGDMFKIDLETIAQILNEMPLLLA
jgi:hypothetical protein